MADSFGCVVLLEGGEGSGKTTLANKLASNHGFIYLKFPSPGSDFEKVIFDKNASIEEKAFAATLDFMKVLRPYRNQENLRIVMDRGPLSTIAYQSAAHLTKAVTQLGGHWAMDMITHAYVMDVDVMVGLGREAAKNAVSAAGLEFHTNVNRIMRECGALLDVVAGPERNLRMYNRMFGSELNRDYGPALLLLRNLRGGGLINTTESTPEGTYVEILERLGLAQQDPQPLSNAGGGQTGFRRNS